MYTLSADGNHHVVSVMAHGIWAEWLDWVVAGLQCARRKYHAVLVVCGGVGGKGQGTGVAAHSSRRTREFPVRRQGVAPSRTVESRAASEASELEPREEEAAVVPASARAR
eukprot:COSAG01_NODE_31393_length_598_cov_1.883768_1_plen_111_part_00